MREEKQERNKELYGLTPEQIEDIRQKLPPPSEVAIFSIDRITNNKKKMSTIEKIVHLQNLEEALLRKIEKFEKSKETKSLQRLESV